MTQKSAKIIHNAQKAKEDVNFDDSIYDLVFVLNISAKGWILERICSVIEEYSGLHCGWIYSESNNKLPNELPPSNAYFYAHYQIATNVYANYEQAAKARNFVYFTHPDFARGVKPVDMLMAFEYFDNIFCMNSAHCKYLQNIGVDSKKLVTVVGGVDTNIFHPPAVAGKMVGFVGGYYERKSPDLMIEIIRDNPSVQFLLLEGDPTEVKNEKIHWINSPYYGSLASLKNLKIVAARYSDYPLWYSKMAVYLSLSHTEGGPISLLEAVSSNVFPVVTDTGFARDVITSGKTGTLLPRRPSPHEANTALRNALRRIRTNIAGAITEFTWEAMAKIILEHLTTAVVPGVKYSMSKSSKGANWLRTGWYPPESDGVWSAPGPALINFRVAAQKRANYVCLEINSYAPDNVVSIGCKMNGECAGVEHWSAVKRRIRFQIPRNVDWRKIDMELLCDHVFVPSTEGMSETDARSLAVFVASLCVE